MTAYSRGFVFVRSLIQCSVNDESLNIILSCCGIWLQLCLLPIFMVISVTCVLSLSKPTAMQSVFGIHFCFTISTAHCVAWHPIDDDVRNLGPIIFHTTMQVVIVEMRSIDPVVLACIQ